MNYISNAFSIQMLAETPATVEFMKIDIDAVTRILNASFVSAIGHTDTAAVVSDMLGIEVPANRMNITLLEQDVLVVAQVVGGRLPEGATTLPDGIKIEFYIVKVL